MKKLLVVCFVLFTSLMSAQIKFKGIVKDSLGAPLELANIIAINQETKKMVTYAVTTEDGRFSLTLPKNAQIKVSISYLGMETIDKIVATKEEDINESFSMREDTSSIDVEVAYEMPVTVKGDTLVYNADSFKTGTERKLEDVLEKLPGVEITDEGEIEVEGKKVSKVMVDGKDFFEGDTKLATKNIPSNAVDKVQVLKNFSNVGQLSGVTNNQNSVALNIKLKEGKKNFWFGNVTAGAGDSPDETLYLAQPKLFYYSPKYSVNIIGDLNNMGEVAFSGRDYWNFSGGFQRPSQESGTNINLGNNSLGSVIGSNSNALNVKSKFGAANFSYSPKKGLDFGGFGIFTSNRTELLNQNTITYTDAVPGASEETTTNRTSQKSDLGMLKLKTKYQPNGNNQLDYAIVGRLSKEREERLTNSSILGNINQNEENDPYSINQTLNYYYTLNEKNIFAFEGQHVYSNEDPIYNAIFDDNTTYQNTGDNIGFDGSQTGYDVVQDRLVKSSQLDAKVNYWNVLNKKSNLNFTLGTIQSVQRFNSNLFQNLDDGTELVPAPVDGSSPKNNIKYGFSDVYLGTHYQVKTGKFTIKPGFSLHAYNTNNKQFGEKTTDNFFRILPDLNVILQLKNSESLTLNYRMQTQFTDVTKFARGLVMNSYNSFFEGNQALENATSHNVNLMYYSFNMFNYTNVFARVSYNKSIDQIRNLTDFESVIRSNSPFNSVFADETVNANGRFQRRFGKFRATLGGNFTYAKFNQFINDTRSVNENFTQNYRLGLRTNFRKWPNLQLGYRYSIQDSDQGSRRTKFYTHAPSVEFDALIFDKFTFLTDYTFNKFQDETRTLNEFDFWNASLSYRKNEDSKLEYTVKATNLLDTKSRNNSSAGNISVSATETFIQPRFISFRIRYEL